MGAAAAVVALIHGLVPARGVRRGHGSCGAASAASREPSAGFDRIQKQVFGHPAEKRLCVARLEKQSMHAR